MILNEGGAMPGVGPIHISEIKPTLQALEKVLGIDLQNNALGSVGKKEFSGDIDVALDIDVEKIPAFVERLKKSPIVLDLAKSSVIMTKVKIVNYDPELKTSRPRTGYVQVDFMPGDPGWMKTYYHSPTDKESKYKGVFRNLFLASIAGAYNRKDSDETTDAGIPLKSERWMFSPTDGLIRVMRSPVPKQSGTGYTKKNNNKKISDSIKTADGIAKALGLDNAADLNSFESLLNAVERKYPQDLVQKIKDAFISNKTVQDIGVPDELTATQSTTESLADKHLARIKQLIGGLR
jgi:hypothetical protein